MIHFRKELIRSILAIAAIDVVGIIVSVFIGKISLVLVFSFLIGSVFSFLNILLLAKTVVNTFERPDPGSGKSYLGLNNLLRYIVLGIVIALSFTRPILSPWGVIPPLLGPKLGILVGGIVRPYKDE